MTDILLIDGQPERGQALAAALGEHGIHPTVAEAMPASPAGSFQCIVADRESVREHLGELTREAPVIVLADGGSISDAVSCMHCGAADYLPVPVDSGHLVASIERATAKFRRSPRKHLRQFPMIGTSEPMQALKHGIAKAAPTDSTVLILGQSGTGKELVARALHSASARSGAPMISINCATVPHNLIEAELFGMAEFDRTAGSHRGLIEAADGGTLFLDEIAELPPPAQARLLRVLHGENRRVGSSVTESVNVRLIAATHRNLEQLVKGGQFREDLYYRLNVICFEIPPLKSRQQDILIIADWLLERTSERLNKTGLSFTKEARDTMLAYHWPGNVRELENAVERAVILSDNDTAITPALLAIEATAPVPSAVETAAMSELTSLEDYFVKFVHEHQDHLTETELAEKLGISRKSLWERRQRLDIPRRRTRKRGRRQDTAAT